MHNARWRNNALQTMLWISIIKVANIFTVHYSAYYLSHCGLVMPYVAQKLVTKIFCVNVIFYIYITLIYTFMLFIALWTSDTIGWQTNWAKIGSCNGLLPDGIKPLPEPMLTYHQWHPAKKKPSNFIKDTAAITSTQVMVYHWWIPCETLVHTVSR